MSGAERAWVADSGADGDTCVSSSLMDAGFFRTGEINKVLKE